MKLLIWTDMVNAVEWREHPDTILIDLTTGQIIYIEKDGTGSMGYNLIDNFTDAKKLLNEAMKEYTGVEELQVTTNDLTEAKNLKAVGFSEEFITKILKI